MAGDPCLDVRSRCMCNRTCALLTDPFVSLEALTALSALLDQVLEDADAPSSNARLRDAYGISRDSESGRDPMAGKTESGRSGSGAQTAPRVTADRICSQAGSCPARRIGPDRPRGRTGGAARADDTPDPREHACGSMTAAPTMAGVRRMIADKICAHHLERKAIPSTCAPVPRPSPGVAQPRDGEHVAIRHAGSADDAGFRRDRSNRRRSRPLGGPRRATRRVGTDGGRRSALGKVGAVSALGKSRASARNGRDVRQQLDRDASRRVDTVLVDQETIYAPRHGNDRLLLGLKGSLNEYELDLLDPSRSGRGPSQHKAGHDEFAATDLLVASGKRALGSARASRDLAGLRQGRGTWKRATGVALVPSA